MTMFTAVYRAKLPVSFLRKEAERSERDQLKMVVSLILWSVTIRISRVSFAWQVYCKKMTCYVDVNVMIDGLPPLLGDIGHNDDCGIATGSLVPLSVYEV